MSCLPPRSPFFPYTTLFRSGLEHSTVRVLLRGARASRPHHAREPGAYRRDPNVTEPLTLGGRDARAPRRVGSRRLAPTYKSASDRKSTRLNSSHLVTS